MGPPKNILVPKSVPGRPPKNIKNTRVFLGFWLWGPSRIILTPKSVPGRPPKTLKNARVFDGFGFWELPESFLLQKMAKNVSFFWIP